MCTLCQAGRWGQAEEIPRSVLGAKANESMCWPHQLVHALVVNEPQQAGAAVASVNQDGNRKSTACPLSWVQTHSDFGRVTHEVESEQGEARDDLVVVSAWRVSPHLWEVALSLVTKKVPG